MARPKASTLFLGFLLFLFFFVLTFPYQNVRGYLFGKIQMYTGIHIMAEDIYPSFLGWPGVGIRNVNVSLPLGNGDLDLSADKLVLRVRLGGIFPPSPGVSLALDGLKKGGDLFVKVTQSRTRTFATIEADDVDMRQLVFSGLPEPIPGQLNLDADITLDGQDFSKTTGHTNLDIRQAKIPALNLQGIILPELKLGNIVGKITIKNGVAEITQFQFGAKDADFNGTLSGDIRLGQSWQMSFLNLTLRVKLSDSYRNNPQGATLVSLLESYRSGNEYAMKWSASIADMSSNIAAALPQRVTN